MKITKLFFMAALALLMTACSNNNDSDFAQQPLKAKGITITARLAPKTDGAATRAVADNGDDKITVTWATDEHIAILYEVGSTKHVADAAITDVNSNGAATIQFTVEDGTPDGTPCTLVYPLSAAKDDHSGVKDFATLLAGQDGTLNANLDVRVGDGTIQTSTPSLTVTTQPAAQFSIFKLTMKDIEGEAEVSAASVVISDQSGTVATVTPDEGCDKVMYVALPTTATTLKFLVTGSDSKKYFNMASGLTLATKFYQSTVKLATVGNVIASNGKCYKNNAATPGGNTAVAMITYLGNDAETNATYRNGLALALKDVSSSQLWGKWGSETYQRTCLDNQYTTWNTAITDIDGIANTVTLVSHTKHTHPAAQIATDYESLGVKHPTGTSEWFLPSCGQWYKMQTAADSYNQLCNSFSSIGGTNMTNMGSGRYWSSTEYSKDYAWNSYYDGTTSNSRTAKGSSTNMMVRSCLAF